MNTDTFTQLFTREGLRPFQPRPGDDGFVPMLEVHTPDAVLVFALALDGFNDGPARFGYLRALGQRCGQEHVVEAVRFGSEAWVRTFTPEEVAARGDRLVETYADKTEAIVVFGQMADGPGFVASAPLFRRADGTVERLGSWTVQTGGQHRAPLLEAFWEGYHSVEQQQR